MKKRKDKPPAENAGIRLRKMRLSETFYELETANKKLLAELSLAGMEIDRLTDLNSTKDKFFSIIAHDLKSPFSSIVGFSDLLVDKVRLNDYSEIETYAIFIQSSSRHVMELLSNLLQWSRSQSGIMTFHPETIKIEEIVNEVISLLNESALRKSITITKDIAENVLVFADRDMLGTIIRNLISNSIKFTYPGGKISIFARSNDIESVITVFDSGIGLKTEDIKKLFRIEECMSKKGTIGEEGTGIGLFICNEFARKHGGEILVKSESGKGSEFIIKFPSQNVNN